MLSWLLQNWTWIFLGAFLQPALEAVLVTAGIWHFHTNFRVAPQKFTGMIIQITTVGKEHERVTQLIDEVRTLGLVMPYQIWVVMEPGFDSSYPRADRVIVVPASFTARGRYKIRALEYARLLRQHEGLGRPDIKILFLDDDTTPTRAYVELAFAGDYDVCQGVTAPRIQYGTGSFNHWVLSHMDDMRFAACFIYCSFFQGLVKKPVYVHGEGLCATGLAEQTVTWDFPVWASEDLVFGQNAARKHLRWGWFHEYIQITSPWSWGAYLDQRRRWLWGNIYAITHRGVLPVWGRFLVAAKYLVGFLTFAFSLAGVILLATHVAATSGATYVFFWASLFAWLFIFAVSGWVNSKHEGETWTFGYLVHRIWHTIAAVLLSPVTDVWTILALFIVTCMGDPKAFVTIPKTNGNGKNGHGNP